MIKEIILPEIADNITSAIVLEILVSVGDKVKLDDTLAEMESDKATFELPSDVSGVVSEVKVNTGDEVSVGQAMFAIDISADGDAVTEDKHDSKENAKLAAVEKEKVKIDKPVQAATAIEKPEKPSDNQSQDKTEQEAPSAVKDDVEDSEKQITAIPASPSVRRLAREIGVDILRVSGNGPNGRITVEDVKSFAKKLIEGGERKVSSSDVYELPDFTKYGPVRREKMDNIRKITARTMSESWQSIPHVFQFDKADVTELENFRKKYSKFVEKEGAKLTFTAILLKLTAEALKAFPGFNASIDMKNEEIVFKEYVNIGVAVDTERGLLVPVIRDADKKSITELSIELNELAEKARKKKIMPNELQGGNFAISNLGGIGGTNFTPIVYRPNVAILGVSRSQMEPVYIDGEFKPRMMLPLSLSYDHRLIDGADGARFIRWLCEALENPLLTMFK